MVERQQHVSEKYHFVEHIGPYKRDWNCLMDRTLSSSCYGSIRFIPSTLNEIFFSKYKYFLIN